MKIKTYEDMVRAIGRGFHPDTAGADYTSLPAGLEPEDVDLLVGIAFVEHEEDGKPDPYARAVKAMEWDGFASQLDLLAATVYKVRAESPNDVTPEHWDRILRNFPGSASLCLAQAQEELEHLYDDGWV